MKRNIRILLTLTGMVLATVSFAQNPTVTYYYDDCGNRIERTMGFKKVEENGIGLGEMNALLLQKIEEMTLHLIEMEKRIQELESQSVENNQ